ncbi:uncharacterized protein LOC126981932 isoform X2 [Eriocheir sinensis]|uniref:uncharacterized protein LOC126981932 isoform X2 n=1 Tax=Eriocheir sinensis TaxID=95602 RepID=UPI0021C8297A|nr:uncharacterized protein LOC126981932 isoform X2 [Eriocheir sinensis]
MMSETKEEAVCNNANNHRQQLLNHQQEIDRDLEAGSCGDDDDEETQLRLDDEDGVEGEEGEAVEGEEGEEGESAKTKQVIPPLYNVEPGCTALGCYSAIATLIVMVIGIVALLMYSSPGNVRADKLVFPNVTLAPDEEELLLDEEVVSSISPSMNILLGNGTREGSGDE